MSDPNQLIGVDFYNRLKNDKVLLNSLDNLFEKIKKENRLVLQGSVNAINNRDRMIMEVLRLCNWNLGILFPLFFPTMIEGKPLNMVRRPFSFMMTALQVSGFTCVRGSRQIAKSTSFVGRQLIKGFTFPRFSSMYICPHMNHKNTYANRFREMENFCPYMASAFPKGTKLRNNLTFKEFPGGQAINIVNCLTDSSQARSKTADELLYDEYQLFDMDLEGDITPCQSVSKTPMTIYAGTSTTVDSPLEFRYQQGSQHTWKVPSPNGKDWIDFGDEAQILKCIRPQGLICPYTNRPLNVTMGEYTPTYANRAKCGLVSVHVPQMIIADKVADALEWRKIYKAYTEYSHNKFMEEFCGIPSEMGGREITEAELKDICTLGTKETVYDAVKRGEYKLIVSGMDWGGSDHIPNMPKSRVSYTVHVILGLAHDGRVHILHMRQHSGMSYNEITNIIANDHKKFEAMAIACDAAGGQVYINNLDQLLNFRTNFRFNYHASVYQMIGVPHHGNANHFTLNKHESISQLFQSIKEKKILCYNWDQSGPRLSEILNIQRILVDPQAGPTKFHYHMTPNKPDDTVHAINYAYVLIRLLSGENVVDDARTMQILQNSVYSSWSNQGHVSFGGMSGLFSGDIVSG